jgi:hypothetical protein
MKRKLKEADIATADPVAGSSPKEADVPVPTAGNEL